MGFVAAIAYLFVAGVVAAAASERGRSALLWFCLAVLITPVIGLLALIAFPNLDGEPTPATHVRCPDCQEFVLKKAHRCKHCGCALTPSQ